MTAKEKKEFERLTKKYATGRSTLKEMLREQELYRKMQVEAKHVK